MIIGTMLTIVGVMFLLASFVLIGMLITPEKRLRMHVLVEAEGYTVGQFETLAGTLFLLAILMIAGGVIIVHGM